MPSSEWPDHGQNVRLSLSLLTPAREVERLREALEFVASCDFAVSADVQAIARKALADDPLIPAPKCETCGGNGRRGGYATDVSYCGDCHGPLLSKLGEMELYDGKGNKYDSGYMAAWREMRAFVDEHTSKEPTP